MPKSDIWVLYSTFPNRDEALSAARILLEKRLIACANLIDNVTSLYRWEGQLQQDSEVVMIAKTAQDRLQAAMTALKEIHSYQVPCITAYPLSGGFPPFFQWVLEETRG